ncbi:MAG: energy transducer TonB [Fimbriimonas sp.]|nr:energy transducer TonB [Fimbriimonas sp.]
MSRRRKKNPLLMRIIGVTVLLHVIALPIAAHFGAFDKLKQRFGEARVTLISLPKQEKEKEQTKEHKSKPKTAKSQGKAIVKRGGPAKVNPNRQKVVAVNSPNDNGSEDGPTIEQGTNTKVGEVPVPKAETGGTKAAESSSPEVSIPKAKTPEPPPSAPATAPKVVQPEAPKHVPVYAEPQQDYCPQPVIPDDLRNETLEKDFVAMFTVGPDGKPTTVKMTQSTGNPELDDIALKTAKQWRFKPATIDGTGVESKVKLTIEFRVE